MGISLRTCTIANGLISRWDIGRRNRYIFRGHEKPVETAAAVEIRKERGFHTSSLQKPRKRRSAPSHQLSALGRKRRPIESAGARRIPFRRRSFVGIHGRLSEHACARVFPRGGGGMRKGGTPRDFDRQVCRTDSGVASAERPALRMRSIQSGAPARGGVRSSRRNRNDGAGACRGTPQLVMPLAHDQFDNAVRVRRLGARNFILPRNFTGGAVAESLQRLKASPDTAQAAKKCATLLRTATPLETTCNLLESAHAGGVRVK